MGNGTTNGTEPNRFNGTVNGTGRNTYNGTVHGTERRMANGTGRNTVNGTTRRRVTVSQGCNCEVVAHQGEVQTQTTESSALQSCRHELGLGRRMIYYSCYCTQKGLLLGCVTRRQVENNYRESGVLRWYKIVCDCSVMDEQ